MTVHTLVVADPHTSPSVDRALHLLTLIARSTTPPRFVELQRTTGIPKGTLHKLLSTLVAAGFARRDEATGSFSIGLTAYEVGAGFTRHALLDSVLAPALDALQRTTGETCHFGALADGDVVYLDRRESTHEVRYVAPLGGRKPAYGTALGKAMLAQLPTAQVEALYPPQLQALTPHTVATRDELLRELDRARGDGYATESEESTIGVRCTGVAIAVADSLYGLSLSIPVQRVSRRGLEALHPHLEAAARQVRDGLRTAAPALRAGR